MIWWRAGRVDWREGLRLLVGGVGDALDVGLVSLDWDCCSLKGRGEKDRG